MTHRTHWQGMWAIVRFNWPFYVAAIAVLIGAVAVLAAAPSEWARLGAAAILAGALWFLVGSLGVSHLVYDRSDLYRFAWLQRAASGLSVRRAILAHAGFDEASALLRSGGYAPEWVLLDHFDPARMTEPSIHRARRLYPPAEGTLPAAFDCWPSVAADVDLVVGLLAIHEFRSESERTAWFREAARALAPRGRVVVVEHGRDFANFLAFGPGFFHFHTVASWQRCWQAAGLRERETFPLTPWLRVFVLDR